MKTILTTIALIAFAATAQAGGPVITEDQTVETERPRAGWVLPIIIGGIVLCAIACGGDDEPDVEPGPICNKGCE